ncbi:MAG: DUF1365 domain-containing protein [Halioglobus sp.]|nr:DUF1365 domain-containing protein [Halioglobus sp.]
MRSRLYEGVVRHRRLHPTPHEFSYRVFMPYICLDELPELFDDNWLWSARGVAPACFRRSDFLGDPGLPLQQEVRRRIREETGADHRGPIYLLANLRYFGISMNPIACYYCFSEDESRLEFLVAEVNNTPWNERHSYVLPGPGRGRWLNTEFDKQFHVSPFNPMDMRYHWRSSTPDHRLVLHLANSDAGRKVFDASLSLSARPMTTANLNRTLWRYPLMTARIALAIYWQALRLFIKRAPVYSHPSSKPSGV